MGPDFFYLPNVTGNAVALLWLTGNLLFTALSSFSFLHFFLINDRNRVPGNKSVSVVCVHVQTRFLFFISGTVPSYFINYPHFWQRILYT